MLTRATYGYCNTIQVSFFDFDSAVSRTRQGCFLLATYSLADGLGTLQPEHANQIAEEKHQGDPESNPIYIRYRLEHDWSNACVYNKEGIPVSYRVGRYF